MGVKILFKRRGITSALVNLGGNIYALGHPPGAATWKIGIQHPREKDVLLGYLELTNMAIATSGDYERFFTADGRRYSHIIDPRTGAPTQGSTVSVTVIAKTATEADALATAVFILGPERGIELLEDREGMGGIIAYERADGEIGFEMTGSMEKIFEKEAVEGEEHG